MCTHWSFSCSRCGGTHGLRDSPARKEAQEIISRLALGSWKGLSPDEGIMIGILETEDQTGKVHFLKAFSGQYRGSWTLPGWAPPLLDPRRFDEITRPVDRAIKELTRRINEAEPDQMRALKEERRNLSRELTKETFALYRVHSIRGDSAPLLSLFPGLPPTGTGDCCAPKLLNHAFRLGLKPLSLAEFYWEGTDSSAKRTHAAFYHPCQEKCAPLMEYMLCPVK